MRNGRCPVCGITRRIPDQVFYRQPPVWVPAYLYQRSYLGEPEYISPRCESCYDKAERKLVRKGGN